MTDVPEHGRPTWSVLRERLESVGFRPSKRLGQNFLVDDAACRAVAEAAGVGPGDTVLEVGVGLGFLTRHLLERGARTIGVEVDERLVPLALEWLGERGDLELVVADVLAGKHELAPEVVERLPREGPWHLVSNLPYAVASPVVALLVRLANPPASITVLVQREVAERLCARPGDPAWGALGAKVALTHAGRLVRPVPAGLFRPRPKVDSAVCRLERRPDPPLDPAEVAAYDALVGRVFTQRRKRLRSPLAALAGGAEAADRWIGEAGLAPDLRVEDLGPVHLLALVRAPAAGEFRERIAGSGPGPR